MLTIPLSLIAQANGEDLMRGLAIAATGLFIVFTALILISLFIAALPRILEMVARVWPETDETHAPPSRRESPLPDNAAVLAAIGFVLHTELQKQLATEKQSVTKS